MATITALGAAIAIWLVSAAATSALVSTSWRCVLPRIAEWHAIDRGRVVLALVTLPALLPTGLLLLVMSPGLLGLVVPAFDHCAMHPDHPHLCLAHPGLALGPGVAMALLAASIAALLAITYSCWANWQSARLLRQLGHVAKTRLAPRVDLVEVDRPLALTFGLLCARTLVSTGLHRSLVGEETNVVLAHEAEHVRRRDPLRYFVARLASVAIWPRVRRELLSELALCAEEACDEQAARQGHDRTTVARTILKVERVLGTWSREPRLGSAGIGGSSVELRVKTLLRIPAPRRSGWKLWLAVPILICLARPLHHEIEHLLSLALGSH
jgi:Zn-dependent protease with chaperone function